MKSISWLKSKESGFTLVELMISVAIMGMLASMASVSYNTFQANARTTEAKMELGAIYAAQQSFFAENGSYTTCLEAAGFAPPVGASFYAEGFTTDFYDCGGDGTQDCNGDGWLAYLCSAPTVGVLGAPAASWWTASTGAGGLPAGCGDAPCDVINYGDLPLGSVSTTQFTVFSSGRVSGSSPNLDQWSINEQNGLVHAQQGY